MKNLVRSALLIATLFPLAQKTFAQKTAAPGNKKTIHITSASDSVVLQAGGTTITLMPNGAVFIKAGGTAGITIDGGEGNVNIKGAAVAIQSTKELSITSGEKMDIKSYIDVAIAGLNIKATAQFDAVVSGTASTTVSSMGTTLVKGAIVGLNGTAKPVARIGDSVSGGTPNGTIIIGCPTVMTGNN